MPILLLLLILCPGILSAEPLRAALILEHDQSSAWTEMLRKGLERCRSRGVEATVIVAPPGKGQAEEFKKAAASHDLVLVGSGSLHDILRNNAANFRRVKFGVIDAGIRAPNIMSVTFADEQAAFLAGAAAAMAAKNTEQPIIGWLSGSDTPAMRSLFNGYSEGAMLARPGIRVIQAVVGSFTDPAEAARKAQWLLNNGASVLALAAGSGNNAALSEASARNVPVIELDSASGIPALGTIAKQADKAIEEIIVAALENKFQGKKIVTYDLANKGVNFELGTVAGNADRKDITRRVGELRKELEQGSIKLRSLRQRTLCDCLD